MNKKYHISIIVCCYNSKNTIIACLNSLKNQFSNNLFIEVILVDDGSEDSTQSRINSFLSENTKNTAISFKYFKKHNEGLSIARNFGVDKANSNIVSFIDDDAIADQYFSKNIVQLFNDNLHVNCIGGKVELLNKNNKFANLIQDSIFSYQMKSRKAVIGTNMSFRIFFFNEVGGFQPEFTYRGDESAFFVKSNNKINILKSNDVIVQHPQPINIKSWLNTRYENGFFGAGVYHLKYRGSLVPYKQIIVSYFNIMLLPVLVLSSINKFFLLFVLCIYIAFIFKRFFISKKIPQFLSEYKSNKKNKKFFLLVNLYITFLVIAGYYFEDFGYLRGYFKYNKYNWI